MRRLPTIGLCLTLLLAVLPGMTERADATMPGALGRIVFVSDADDASGEIYIRDYYGNTTTRLTFNLVGDYFPKWSPDGSTIAFFRGNEVWVMDADGSNQTNLTNGSGGVSRPVAWSPDSTLLLFSSSRGGDPDLWTMRPDGSDPQQLTNTADTEFSGDWSPDGSTIVYSRDVSPPSLWLVDADGTNRRELISVPGSPVSFPTWSPDGSRVAFGRETASGGDIWVVDADGTDAKNLTNDTMYSNWGPVWSPDGSKIAFASNRDGDSDLWTINPDGSGVAHLTDNPADEFEVSFESVNRNPKAVDDEASVAVGGMVSIPVLANDSDPDGETIVVSDVTVMARHGSVSIGVSGTITYTHDRTSPPPAAPLPYSDTFEYEIQDTRLGSDRGEVTVWITGEAAGFDDVPPGHLFYDDVMWLASQGITKGCNPPMNDMFCPAEPVTRGQMAAFLVRALGQTDLGGGDLFVDDDGSVFEGDIDKLGTAGVTRGCNPPVNDRFCPNDVVTRGQMAAFLVRAYGFAAPPVGDLFIDDDGSVFEADIDKLGSAGVTRGCNPPVNDRFCPTEVVTREQMAAFIHRAVS